MEKKNITKDKSKLKKNNKVDKNVEKKVDKVNKKENIFKKITKYFKGVLKEINRIRWTGLSDLLKYSIATLVLVLFLGLYFYGIDWLVLLIRSLVK